MVAMGTEDAEIMARDGITKKQVKQYLGACRCHSQKFQPGAKVTKAMRKLLRESPHVTPDGIATSVNETHGTSWLLF